MGFFNAITALLADDERRNRLMAQLLPVTPEEQQRRSKDSDAQAGLRFNQNASRQQASKSSSIRESLLGTGYKPNLGSTGAPNFLASTLLGA